LIFGLTQDERERLGVIPFEDDNLKIVIDISVEKGISISEAAKEMGYGHE